MDQYRIWEEGISNTRTSFMVQELHEAPVVQRMDNFTQWISCSPVDKMYWL